MASETYPATAFSSGVARGRLATTIAVDPVIAQPATYIALHTDGSVVINFAVALTVAQKAALDTIVAAHNGRPLPARSDLGTLAAVAGKLSSYGFASPESQLLMDVYEQLAELPNPPPAGFQFALVADGDLMIPRVAYWDGLGAWVLTEYPWRPPGLPLPPGASWVVGTDPSVGSGSNSWSYVMGTEFQITQPSQLQAMAVNLASAGTTHAYTVRKSTAPGAATPPLSSYTTLLASGTVTVPTPATWVDVGLAPGAGLAVNDWVIATVSVQVGGKLGSISALRAAGAFDESKATVQNGLYGFHPEALPGATPNIIPTSRSGTLYGMTSIALV